MDAKETGHSTGYLGVLNGLVVAHAAEMRYFLEMKWRLDVVSESPKECLITNKIMGFSTRGLFPLRRDMLSHDSHCSKQ